MKGGVGKSTDAILLANNLAARGFKVLFFDMDTNNSSTIYYTLGIADEFPTRNVAEALTHRTTEGYAVKSRIPNVDIVPSSLRLFDIRPGDCHALKKTLPDGRYDFVVIDTAPTYDNLVTNALYAADCIFTPVQPGFFNLTTTKFLRSHLYDELTEQDGKIHCIQGFVDDATGCPYLYMMKNECLLGYVEAFRNMAADKGIPKAIYPDKASVFFVNNKKDDGERHLTQFGVMMENMGVDMFPAHSPQAKGRIERFWQTIKRRLPNLFVRRGIDTAEKANEFLLNEFPKLWQKWFPVRPASEESFFVRAAMNEVSEVLRATFPGKVDRGGIFLLKGYRFFCPELCGRNVLIFLNEKEGLWVEDMSNPKKRYIPRLVETDTTGNMPIVMQDLIERVFLRNAKPKFREVYIDIDDVVLSKIKRNKKSVA